SKAWALFKAGRAGDGLAPVEQALRLKPDDANAIDTRAHIREALGDLSGALDDFRRALNHAPTLTASSEGLARVSAKLANLQSPSPPKPADSGRRVALVIGYAAHLRGRVRDGRLGGRLFRRSRHRIERRQLPDPGRCQARNRPRRDLRGRAARSGDARGRR